MATLSKSQIADRISLNYGIISDEEAKIKGYKKRTAENKKRFGIKYSYEYAIGQCQHIIKEAKKEIAVLKRAQKEAAKKPVNKVLVISHAGMAVDKKEYPDSDFPYHRLCFYIVDKNGWKVYLEASPWHKPLYVGKRRKLRYDTKSLAYFRGCYENGRGCYGCYEDAEIRATKAELLKYVNTISRDHYTRLTIKK